VIEPTPISNLPRGLVSLFGLNTFGSAPNLMSNQIVPTFDIKELLLLNRELLLGSNNTTPGLGGLIFNQSIVPPGELWYVWSAGIRSGTLAGESLRINGAYTQSGALLPAGDSRSCGGVAAEQLGLPIGQNFWLGPGAGIGAIVEEETGLAKTLTWFMVIVRLRI
jgi:hypothetical protein